MFLYMKFSDFHRRFPVKKKKKSENMDITGEVSREIIYKSHQDRSISCYTQIISLRRIHPLIKILI